MSRDRLAFYPYVIVRVSCRHCTRRGSYRLARLGAKYGPEIGLIDTLTPCSQDPTLMHTAVPSVISVVSTNGAQALATNDPIQRGVPQQSPCNAPTGRLSAHTTRRDFLRVCPVTL